MEARAPHDFEHDALVPGPGNAEHFSLAFTTWRKVKRGRTAIDLDIFDKVLYKNSISTRRGT
jgi:hypothetical protein